MIVLAVIPIAMALINVPFILRPDPSILNLISFGICCFFGGCIVGMRR